MTNTEAGLLDDIIANPADDVPRLIYADWLEEHGQEERAEFIRVQIELTQCPDPFDNRELSILYRAPAFLDFPGTKQDDFGWNGTGSTEIEYDSGVKTVFRRGFLTEVHAPFAVLAKHLPRLVWEHPIERVRVTDREPHQFTTHAEWGRWPGYPGEDPKHTIPEDIWLMLQHATTTDVRQHWSLAYSTADAAHAALSVALLKRARTKSQPIEVM